MDGGDNAEDEPPLPDLALFAYGADESLISAVHTPEPTSPLNPDGDDVTDEEQPNVTPSNLRTANLDNARRFAADFPDYCFVEPSPVVKFPSANSHGALCYKSLYAHRLVRCEYFRAEVYALPTRGGMLKNGNFEDALAVLESKVGAMDEFREEFRRRALAVPAEEIQRALSTQSNSCEDSLTGAVETHVAFIAAMASGAKVASKRRVPFVNGGLLAVLTADQRNIRANSGFIGLGDLNFLNGKTGQLEVAIELKLQRIRRGWLKNKNARTLANQGIGFMVGRNLDFLMLLTSGGFLLIWRVLVGLSPSGAPRFEYPMWPDRQYASLEDAENVRKLNLIFGEYARISAYKPGTLPNLAILTPITETISSPVVGSETDANTSRPEDQKSQGGNINTKSQTSKDETWYAVTSQGDIPLSKLDLRVHLSVEEVKSLVGWKKPEKDVCLFV